MRLPWPLVALSLASCVTSHVVGGLQPHPNLPDVPGAGATVIQLDDGIPQKLEVTGVTLDTFRGDLKRGFLNGFPGASKGEKGSLHLILSMADPSLTCVAYVGCYATLRFKGKLISNQLEGTSFAGSVKSDVCHEYDACFNEVIEHMYEQIFVAVKDQLRQPAEKTDRPTTQL